ncbi:MAG TPA: type VI secretion system protein TssA [Bryobacteraceae bacterium]|nr:type VI secretion system protein TssA [Bryobacteraceae bacterium]
MPLREGLLAPIPGENPSGENLRYAPVYDQIKEARRQEAEVAQGEWQHEIKRADWGLVVKLASTALATKSKDLQIAAWLTEALLCSEGFSGLREGLDLMRGLLENFWDSLYPEIEDGDTELRATPLDWVGSRFEESVKHVPLTGGGLDWFRYKESRAVPYEAECAENEAKQQARATSVEDGKLTPEEFDSDFDATPAGTYEQWQADLDGCLESLETLGSLSDEKFGDYAPNFGTLRSALEEIRQTVRILLARKGGPATEEAAPAAEVEVAAPVVESGGWAAAPVRAPSRPAAVRKPGAEPADPQEAMERVAAAARYLRQQDPGSPAPYLMVRGMRWGELRAAGEGYEPDAALLEAPATEIRQNLKRLAGEAEWQQVLDIAEEAAALPCGRAWLDVQRYAVSALENLGYYPPAWAIKSELRALLADLPNLPEMSLSDDTPTANAETRAWLKEFAASAAPVQETYAPPRPARQERELEDGEFGTEAGPDAFELALQAAQSGRAGEAVEILSREIAQEPSGRGRFQRKVQLAQICLAGGHAAIAYPILEDLAAEIERRKLEEWEPADTIAHALTLLFRSMEKMEIPAEEKQKIYGRICRLDPVQALAMSR